MAHAPLQTSPHNPLPQFNTSSPTPFLSVLLGMVYSSSIHRYSLTSTYSPSILVVCTPIFQWTITHKALSSHTTCPTVASADLFLLGDTQYCLDHEYNFLSSLSCCFFILNFLSSFYHRDIMIAVDSVIFSFLYPHNYAFFSSH